MTGIPDAPDLPDFAFLVQPEQFTVGEGITDYGTLA